MIDTGSLLVNAASCPSQNPQTPSRGPGPVPE